MQADWREFLERQGAVITDGLVTTFPEDSGEGQIELFDLSHLGLIRAQGTDARNYLHNQFTNSVQDVTEYQGQLNSYCNAKGRMLASFQLFLVGDAYYLQLPSGLLDTTLKRLRMYVMRSKVSLEDASDAIARFGIAGPQAEEHVKSIVGKVPGRDYGTYTANGITALRLPGLPARFELLGPMPAMSDLWTQLKTQATLRTSPDWRLLDIEAAVPTLFPANVESFVPQMANLELIGGVSFSKGCYPGQEVVARTHYLGKVKKRMFRARVEGGSPEPGMDLYCPADRGEQSVGRVVDAQPVGDDHYELLAVLQISSRETDDVRLGRVDGPRLSFLGLPYSLEKDTPKADTD
ncbi:MAG: folate-binding protein YgfZ [Chromatiales bacterium]|nr:folate-binding protein YgfZ [Chromatiales bacterium]